MTKPFKPYLMPGPPRRTKPVKTLADPPDRRVPSVPIRTLSVAELRKIPPLDRIHPTLRSTDNMFQRWTVTPTAGPGSPRLASVKWGRTAALTALSDRDSQLLEWAIKTSPNWVRSFVAVWYRSDRTIPETCTVLEVPRADFCEYRHRVLSYFLGRLSQMGLELVTIDVALEA